MKKGRSKLNTGKELVLTHLNNSDDVFKHMSGDITFTSFTRIAGYGGVGLCLAMMVPFSFVLPLLPILATIALGIEFPRILRNYVIDKYLDFIEGYGIIKHIRLWNPTINQHAPFILIQDNERKRMRKFLKKNYGGLKLIDALWASKNIPLLSFTVPADVYGNSTEYAVTLDYRGFILHQEDHKSVFALWEDAYRKTAIE